ncbi:MAG: hypothetical protein DWI02_04370 [Planctomycetota bacterium]|nr:MAG: hypothetical protein DWI02_04370 [Planctomycetota bacterium]
MSCWKFRLSLSLIAVLLGALVPQFANSAEPGPVKPLPASRWKSKSQAKPVTRSSEVVPVSYLSMAELQDCAEDSGETVRDRAHERAARIYQDSQQGRGPLRTVGVLHTEHENCRDWFNYIRGHGPAIWTRNGPECGCHPPSIPFAKRVGGDQVAPWPGVSVNRYPR